MRAVAFTRPLPVDDPHCLVDIEIDTPEPGPRDLRVKVEAVSVNPVDFKVRRSPNPTGAPRILGFDAAGTVEAVGAGVSLFKVGDPVFYAGSIARPGTNAEYHLVDERIAGSKPKSLGFAEAAALPLTAITAWELLFDRIGIKPGATDAGRLLVISGAGGVGSMAIQIVRALTDFHVIATASRPESVEWVRRLGAHEVIDHSRPLADQLAAGGGADIVLVLGGTRGHAAAVADIVTPEGHVGVIEGAEGFGPDELGKLSRKSAGLHFELMFTRPTFGTPDMIEQHRLLNAVADMVDEGTIRTTMTENLGPISAASLREAHRRLESGRTIGKIVVAGW